MTPPSRNEPCPCGSGKRYKHCCGTSDAQAAGALTERAAPVATLMRAALSAQTAGRNEEAEQLYRRVLAIAPDEPDALQSLGLVRFARGDLAEARSLVLRALDLTQWKYP